MFPGFNVKNHSFVFFILLLLKKFSKFVLDLRLKKKNYYFDLFCCKYSFSHIMQLILCNKKINSKMNRLRHEQKRFENDFFFQ